MKNRKRRVELLSFYDHVGISRHLEKWLRKVGCLKRLQTWAGFIAGLSRSNFTSQFPTIPKHLNLTLSQRRIRKHFMISALIRAGACLLLSSVADFL